jgi:hypothetical protein
MTLAGGVPLSLGVVGVLAVAGAARRRGSRAVEDSSLDASTVRRLDALARDYRGIEPQKLGLIPYRNREGNLRFARENGLTFLGMGTGRSVFAVPVPGMPGGLALKIGNDADNRTEARVWREAPAWMQALLVPVLGVAEDGSWIAMERVKPITEAAHAKLRDDLAFRRARRPLVDCGLSDLGMANTASDGRVLDYAFLGNEQQWRKCVEPGEKARLLEWMARGSDPKLLQWVKNG